MELLYTILGLFIFLIAVKYQYLRKKNRKLRPPSPPALPILGHLHLVKTAPHLALQKLSIKYGPLISLHFGIRPFLVVSSPSLAEECLTKTNDIIFANRPESVSSKYLGYNSTALIISPYGDHWRNLRRVTTIHMFSSIQLQRLSSIWTEEIHFIIKKLFSNNSDEKTWKVKDMSSLFRELLFNVIMKIAAGKRWPSDQPGDIFSPRALTDLCDYIPILRWVGYGGLEKGVISLHQKRDEFLQGLIDQTRKEVAEDGSCSTERRKTIIQKLLSLQEAEPEYYTDEIVKGIIQLMLSAGTHTTSQTMEWALSSLLNHPNVLQKARDELEKMQPGHLLNDSDLSKLPYLRCIINETLRLFPAAPTLVPHFSSEDCTIGGYEVPKGTTLLVNVWAIHRDPNVWEEPNKYKPERFEGMDEGGWNEGFKFLPFGKGRRICPGAAMAIRLVGLTLGTLIQCFEWERAGPEMVDLEENQGATLGKAKPLEASYKPRPSMIKTISQL
ncbi:cytochrome P450 81Q32-like [Coffea arabica]|uniref:Cytochrome P450 81Q32-like n=1 Tax=Coffea arabica TaxID=13443 RepID=A0ABM4UVH4_COFAR